MNRKFLFVDIILLTLLPMLTYTGFSCIRAQQFAYENGAWALPDINVNGNAKEMCDACGKYFNKSDIFCQDCYMVCIP